MAEFEAKKQAKPVNPQDAARAQDEYNRTVDKLIGDLESDSLLPADKKRAAEKMAETFYRLETKMDENARWIIGNDISRLEKQFGLDSINREIPFAKLSPTITVTSRPIVITGLPPGAKISTEGFANIPSDGTPTTIRNWKFESDEAVKMFFENSKVSIKSTGGTPLFECRVDKEKGGLHLHMSVRQSSH